MRNYVKRENISINGNQTVKIKECGNIVEVLFTTARKHEARVIKLSKDYYVRVDTGEVLEVNHGDSRFSNTQSVKHSLMALRDYINTNVTDIQKCRWLTLTYAENMTDPQKLQCDFQAFNRRCRKRYGHYEYITAVEPQGRGAWHLHAVFIFKKSAPFMDNSVVREMWKQGFVNVRKLTDVDNIGLYLTAYLADMPLDEVIQNTGKLPDIKENKLSLIEVIGKDGKKETKSFVKGERMKMYPVGFNIYRCSRGIKKPVITEMCNAKAENIVAGYTKIYENSVEISDTEHNYKILTNKRVYNKLPNARIFKGGAKSDKGKNADN